MLGSRQLSLETLHDRCSRESEHISIALVLPDDAGSLQRVDQVISHLARQTQRAGNFLDFQSVAALRDGEQNLDGSKSGLYSRFRIGFLDAVAVINRLRGSYI